MLAYPSRCANLGDSFARRPRPLDWVADSGRKLWSGRDVTVYVFHHSR
jgi:hypothetical protein